MKIGTFFSMRPRETLHSEKNVERLTRELNSMICFNTNLLTVNRDSREYLFIPLNKQNPSLHELIPTLKASGFRSSTLMPVFDLEIVSRGAMNQADLIAQAAPHRVFWNPIVRFIFILAWLSGAGMMLNSIRESAPGNFLMGLFWFLIPTLLRALGFWLPYSRTLGKLKWLVSADLEEERQKELHLEEVLKEYDRRAGISDDDGRAN